MVEKHIPSVEEEHGLILNNREKRAVELFRELVPTAAPANKKEKVEELVRELVMAARGPVYLNLRKDDG